jgi:peroxiredoxin
MITKLARFALLSLFISACGSGAGVKSATTSTPAPVTVALRDDSGHEDTLGSRVAQSKLTVLFFFSSDCPVQKAHDARIRELAAAYRERGVAFYAVISEVGADLPAERQAAKERGIAFPVLEDRGAALADKLGVEYSTHSVVIDHDGAVLYSSGGIDSDRTHLSAGSEQWLKRALDAATAGRPVEKVKTEPLGCPLRKH